MFNWAPLKMCRAQKGGVKKEKKGGEGCARLLEDVLICGYLVYQDELGGKKDERLS